MLNISNIPALTDIKSNFRIYGKARVLEDDKVGAYYEEERNNYQEQMANRPRNTTVAEVDKEKDESK